MSEEMVLRLAAMDPKERKQLQTRTNTLYAKAAEMKRPAAVEKWQGMYEQKVERERHEKELEGLKRTREEIAAKVHSIRLELEAAKLRYDGAIFDAIGDQMPRSMDNVDKREIYEIVEDLNPCLEAFYKRCSAAIKGRLNDDLGDLRWQMAEYAFQLGMLNGFIFAGCSEQELDRFERAFVHATAARHWEVKGSHE